MVSGLRLGLPPYFVLFPTVKDRESPMSSKAVKVEALNDALKITMQYASSEDHSVGKIDEVLESVYRTIIKLQDDTKIKNHLLP